MNKITWSEQEDSLLLNLRNKGIPYTELLEVFPSKSQDALRNRFYILNKKSRLNFERDARVLVLDIETSLMVFTAFSTGHNYLTDRNIVSDFFVMSWAAKWLNEADYFSAVLTPKEAKSKNDKRILKELLPLLNEADLVVYHNGDKFDAKKLNTRFIFHGLDIPEYKGIDTLKLARKHFSFSSNKLDYICKFLGLPAKSEHSGYETWLKCLAGDAEELNTLVKYNENDIFILETLYNRIKQVVKIRKPRTGWKNDD
jgi:DNA polymerase III alpha subunit (gram-positive type)